MSGSASGDRGFESHSRAYNGNRTTISADGVGVRERAFARLRLTHLPENTAPTLLRTLPVPDGYRSVDEFAAALCLVMDEELRRQTSVVVHEINFQDVIGG